MVPSLREQTDSGPGVMKRETVCEGLGETRGPQMFVDCEWLCSCAFEHLECCVSPRLT